MRDGSIKGLDRRRLRLLLGALFLGLAVPSGVLVHRAYSQLKWETFHRYRIQAQELAARIEGRLARAIDEDEARSFGDFAFLVIAGDPTAGFLQRSPLSAFPVPERIPGVLGHFQVDAAGRFSTPLLPSANGAAGAYGVSGEELAARTALRDRLLGVLAENRLVESASLSASPRPPAPKERSEQEVPAPQAQAAFDRLKSSPPLLERSFDQATAGAPARVEDLDLEDRLTGETDDASGVRLPARQGARLDERSVRKERGAVPEPAPAVPAAADERERKPSPMRVTTFESAIDPFDLSRLASGHFVLFRRVWRDGQRYIQGALLDGERFFDGAVAAVFRESALFRMTELVVAYDGEVSALYGGRASRGYLSSAEDLNGQVLYRTRLPAPLAGLELIFSVTHLPAGPGAPVVGWLAAILGAVLLGGFYLMYRLGLRQIALHRQQQDFVSAVSHELRTPLTAIRMYAEMLREGWADDAKKADYYDYIHGESERLSRLITNVLQLARMNRNELRPRSRPVTVQALLDGVRSKVCSQVERAGFELNVQCDEATGRAVLEVDDDFFSQIMINLVDNALKFSAGTETRRVELGCRGDASREIVFTLRDFGPGIPSAQITRIFRLFYRARDELTRETVGTGIGLALVRQLAGSMDGHVDVFNRSPGAEFQVSFPRGDAGEE